MLIGALLFRDFFQGHPILMVVKELILAPGLESLKIFYGLR